MSGYDKSPDYGGPPFRWRELIIPAIVIIAVALVWVFWPSKAGAGSQVRVVDGDTIELDGVTYRLHGIDAPEAGQKCRKASGGCWPCGKDAIAVMESLVIGEAVTCDNRGIDDYSRVIGVCSVNGQDINARMVSKGYAWVFRKYSLDYAALEDTARAARLGIWQADTQTAWDYRAERWDVGVQESPEGCPIKGNISKNGRIYHAPWSPWYSRTKVSVDKGERWFCDEAEALQAGWRAPYWGR
ncbi:MAG: thermonuclease family protein [Alphaproteobacteria bacterium]|nr:thermonuclease family protein [Alphaproteobacteria bacterium]